MKYNLQICAWSFQGILPLQSKWWFWMEWKTPKNQIWLQKYFIKRSVNCGVMSPSMSFSFIVHFIYNLSTSNVHHLLGYQASFYFFFILCRKEWVTSNNDTMLLQQTWCIHLISSLLSLPFSDKSQIFTITTRVGHGTFRNGMDEQF